MLVALCLCVVIQMLGAPTTMSNPNWADDGVRVAVIEGLSIPFTEPTLCRIHAAVALSELSRSCRAPFLDRSQFHPPDLSHRRHASGKVSGVD